MLPVLPPSLLKDALICNHDVSTGNHLGTKKTLKRLHHDAFWINMARDVENTANSVPPVSNQSSL